MKTEPKRILWIIPNFRTSPILAVYKPLAVSEKFKIATQDSFDRGTVANGLLFGAVAQASDSNPSFGQGVRGYAHYAGTAYADYVIGEYMTEAVFSHDPPSVSPLFSQGHRQHVDAVSKLGNQLAVDLAANLLREFIPDLRRKFSRKNNSSKGNSGK